MNDNTPPQRHNPLPVWVEQHHLYTKLLLQPDCTCTGSSTSWTGLEGIYLANGGGIARSVVTLSGEHGHPHPHDINRACTVPESYTQVEATKINAHTACQQKAFYLVGDLLYQIAVANFTCSWPTRKSLHVWLLRTTSLWIATPNVSFGSLPNLVRVTPDADLYHLIENCENGTLHNKLVQDRIMVARCQRWREVSAKSWPYPRKLQYGGVTQQIR